MGGPNSTRWRGHRKKSLVENVLALDCDALVRQEIIAQGKFDFGILSIKDSRSGNEISSLFFEINTVDPVAGFYFEITYDVRIGGTKNRIHCKIPLSRSNQFLGGFRWFFHCPSCGKRFLKLYNSGIHYICRNCAELSYRSSQEQHRFYGLYREIAKMKGAGV